MKEGTEKNNKGKYAERNENDRENVVKAGIKKRANKIK